MVSLAINLIIWKAILALLVVSCSPISVCTYVDPHDTPCGSRFPVQRAIMCATQADGMHGPGQLQPC